MNQQALVVLLSDFGLKDHYVGVMKARILRECPEARMVDLTHQVLPQSVAEGSYYLQQSVAQFPAGTVFLAVVDPGVGSTRKAIAATAGGYFFVAPDNGLLSEVLSQLGGLEIAVELEVPAGASNTFHGRDVFAPAAGRLAAGASLESLGRTLPDLMASTGRTTIFRESQLEITVLTIIISETSFSIFPPGVAGSISRRVGNSSSEAKGLFSVRPTQKFCWGSRFCFGTLQSTWS